MKNRKSPPADACPCGNSTAYAACCGRFIEGRDLPETAEALMRSRYTAYTRHAEAYLLQTWHASTRPERLDLAAEENTKWLGLEIKQHVTIDETHASVEFVARFRLGGRAHRLHENSRFVRDEGRWHYVDGDIE